MTRAPLLLALLVSAALLVGCGSDPADERRDAVAALTEAANARDADGVRAQADALVATVAAQLARRELAADEAERLTALAQSVRRAADVIDQDLIERREAERAAQEARRQLEEARKKLEEERRKAEEAARKAEEDGKGDEGKGNGDEGKGDKDD